MSSVQASVGAWVPWPWFLTHLLLGLPKPSEGESASVRKACCCPQGASPGPLTFWLDLAAGQLSFQNPITVSKGSKVQGLLVLGTAVFLHCEVVDTATR